MTHRETTTELDVISADHPAFEFGDQFLTKVKSTFDDFKGYEGPDIIQAHSVEVDVCPQPHQRLWATVHLSEIISHYIQGIDKEGYKLDRQLENMFGLDVTELERISISLAYGDQYEALLSGKYRRSNPAMFQEHGYFAIRELYKIRNLGALSIALW